mmetsp:Transcript_102432/g.289678  ORF Transcript_102432/g.289678 Transcript_102432/m.289678 type:complete len:335 (+) Transcript_102432:2-1006(+)
MLEAAGGRGRFRPWVESLMPRIFGEGDPDRKEPVRVALVLLPWFCFVVALILWTLVRHKSFDFSCLLTVVMFCGCMGMLGVWSLGKRWGPVSLLPLGMLCLLGTGLGVLIGTWGWEKEWRQYWWLQTGRRVEHAKATTPVGAALDAAVIGFWDNTNNRTVDGTLVDSFRSAGYKDGSFYCVAPVLSPETAGAAIARVSYWAVGIDCCEELGSFTCGASREQKGAHGMVMPNGGFPCPTCNVERFQAAVRKAEAVHGLLSAKGALMLRWVTSVEELEQIMLREALLLLMGMIVAVGLILCGLGTWAWYVGLGNGPAAAKLAGSLRGSYGAEKQEA